MNSQDEKMTKRLKYTKELLTKLLNNTKK